MIKEELVKRSPLRALDQSIKGGLLPGSIGVFVSPKGVGKTACLVHVAIDQLLQGKKVLHLSFSDTADHVANWYSNLYSEISSDSHLEKSSQRFEEMMENRMVLHLGPGASSLTRVEKDIGILREAGGFDPQGVIVDGYGPSRISDLQTLCAFFRKLHIPVWFSLTQPDDASIDGFTAETLSSCFDVIIRLEEARDHTLLKLEKDYDLTTPPEVHLELDPKTLLIRKET